MRTLKLKPLQIAYTLAITLTVLAIALAGSSYGLSQDSSANVGTQAGGAANAEKPRVEINGQTVDLGADGKGSFNTQDGSVEVDSSSSSHTTTGDTTVFTHDDGSVDVSVESNSNHGSSKTKVEYNGQSSYEFEEESSVEVRTRGEANVSVSN